MRVTLELPGRIARDYQSLTDASVWLSFEDAVRNAVIQSWRFERASCVAARLDLTSGKARADEDDDVQAPGAAAAIYRNRRTATAPPAIQPKASGEHCLT